MDEQDFTPEERKALRRIIREDQARRQQEAQERAAGLTSQLRAQYGPLHHPGK